MAGGAFGRNLNTIHMLLACMAAKDHPRAVKVILTRAQTFPLLSHRGEVRQRLRLGARADGRLTAIVQEADVAKGTAGAFVEPVGEVGMQLYAHDAHLVQHRVAALDLSQTGWMRAPGVSSAVFAIETSMDDLAAATGLDPLELRRRNHADTNPQTGKPWASKSLLACYAAGAEAIGWVARPPGGTERLDGRLTGYGMATSFDLGRQFPASARVTLNADGTAEVALAATEIGQGLWTALAGIAADALGLPRERLRLVTDTTDLPYAAGSIGSTGTVSNGTAILEAVGRLRGHLAKRAVRDRASPAYRANPAVLHFEDGVFGGEPTALLLARHGPLAATAHTGRTFGQTGPAKASFGAVFAEISLDPLTGALAVERMVGAFACGRILEPAIARSQLLGGMTWGIGQALMEESRVDRRTGRWTNADLAEALIPVNADVRDLRAITIDEDDTAAHPLGAKGLAEIGVVGPAPAIANAIHDATGHRPRALPITLRHRLEALGA